MKWEKCESQKVDIPKKKFVYFANDKSIKTILCSFGKVFEIGIYLKFISRLDVTRLSVASVWVHRFLRSLKI